MSSVTFTSNTTVDEDRLRSPSLTDSGETSTSSTPYTAVPFSAGNPTIEETRGLMNLVPEDTISSLPKIPVDSSPFPSPFSSVSLYRAHALLFVVGMQFKGFGFQEWRKPLLCVLEVPNHMTYADFCMFCGSFIENILDMRIVR